MYLVETIERETIEFCVDLRIMETPSLAIVAVILEPCTTRTERREKMLKIKKEYEDKMGKEVFVTADLDIYCKLAKEDCNAADVLVELNKRGSFV